jgi:hypothetical protein
VGGPWGRAAKISPVNDHPSSSRSRRRLIGAVALLLIAGTVACGGDDDDSAAGEGATATTQPVVIGEVRTFDVPSRDHSDEVQDYPQTPPVGGDHAPAWENCGFYETPIYKETGVHSMEHGAVWITFRADLPADQVAQIQTLAQQPYTLASPWDPADGELPAPIVFSAWGAQVALDSLPAPAADSFLTTYRQSLDAPEPGAPCTGGLDVVK